MKTLQSDFAELLKAEEQSKKDLLGVKDVIEIQESVKKQLTKDSPQKDKESVLEGSNAFFLKHGEFYFKDLK